MALLSNFDIIDICNHLQLPLVGIFMKDQLPKNKNPPINLPFYSIKIINYSQYGKEICLPLDGLTIKRKDKILIKGRSGHGSWFRTFLLTIK